MAAINKFHVQVASDIAVNHRDLSEMQTAAATAGLTYVIGNATRVPGNPGNPPLFIPVNPGLCAGKNPGLTGLISGVKNAQKSVQ